MPIKLLTCLACRILGALPAKGTLKVDELAKMTDMPNPTVSHHLAMLRAARFIEAKRDGKALNYALTEKDAPRGTPLHFHPLRENWAGHFAVRIDKKYRIVFKPCGEFERLPDDTPDLATVTEIEITAVEDYHDG